MLSTHWLRKSIRGGLLTPRDSPEPNGVAALKESRKEPEEPTRVRKFCEEILAAKEPNEVLEIPSEELSFFTFQNKVLEAQANVAQCRVRNTRTKKAVSSKQGEKENSAHRC